LDKDSEIQSYQKLSENIPVGIFLMTSDFRVVMWNRCLTNWTALEKSQIIGHKIDRFFPEIKNPKYYNRILDLIEGAPPIFFSAELHKQVFRISLPNHKLRINNTTFTPITLGEEEEFHILVSIQDLTDLNNSLQIYKAMKDKAIKEVHQRRKVERSLKENAQILQGSIRDLKDFAHTISHDLQEPLRKVIGFGDLLKMDFSSDLPEGAVDLIVRMQNATVRMRELLNDVLKYSQIQSGDIHYSFLSLDYLIQEVLEDLEMPIREKNAKVEVGTLPKIIGDKAQIQQLFQNLIGNALKFNQPGIPPLIRIYSEDTQLNSKLAHSPDPICEIVVEDNGIGFEPHYEQKIFGIFQRLHRRNEYKGTGVGLAICKKIVMRHRGNIRAESQKGQGTKFLINLPLKDDKKMDEYVRN